MIRFKAIDSSGSLIKSALSPFTFPAGEAHAKVEDRRELEDTEIAILNPSRDSMHADLFHLAMWNDHIARYNAHSNHTARRVALIPYFPGARADRGTPFGLGVYADFIRNLDLDQLVIFDPHSGVTTELLPNATVLEPADLIGALSAHYDGVIAPDAGAVRRAGRVASTLGVPLLTATKKRNYHTGKLEGYNAPEGVVPAHRYLVVDDICDGGGTFMLLADSLDGYGVFLDLWVSHGIFSGRALEMLPTKYDHIYTTDSYASERLAEVVSHEQFGVLSVTSHMLGEIITEGAVA
jgi:ribose-phosphate pyrophosphokinase